MNLYNNVFYTYCDDVGENKGGYFIQFYADSEFEIEIDNMVLHANTDEVVKSEEYIKKYIDDQKLKTIAAEVLKKNKINNKDYKQEKHLIETTQELLNSINAVEKFDMSEMRNIANSIDLCNTFYTFELKQAILDKLEVIELNHLDEKLTFTEIKKDIIDVISDISELYGVKIEETEDDEIRD